MYQTKGGISNKEDWAKAIRCGERSGICHVGCGFTFELEAGKSARLFEFRVPTGAIAMAVRVRSSNPKDINVDAYIGKSIKPEDKPEK